MTMTSPEVDATPHGRVVDYNRGCRCKKCQAANTRKQAKARARRRANRTAADRAGHGKASTYDNYQCRCPDCTKANAERCQHYRETRSPE